jgi:hypothetical protein
VRVAICRIMYANTLKTIQNYIVDIWGKYEDKNRFCNKFFVVELYY